MAGKDFRKGLSLIQIANQFNTEEKARKWLENKRWPKGQIVCPYCGSKEHIVALKHPTQTHRCKACRRAGKKNQFNVKTNTIMEESNIPCRLWAIGVYLYSTNIKGISSMKLHRELGITQKSAWFLLHRLRQASHDLISKKFESEVEVDETFLGGKRKNMSNSKRAELKDTGRGAVGKTAVAGIKNRDTNQVKAEVVESVDKATLLPFMEEYIDEEAKVYTDEALVYNNIPFEHESVKHSLSEYVNEMAHTNGIESFWAMFKRGYYGTYHWMSKKHVSRYVSEFCYRHNQRNAHTIDQMSFLVGDMVGKRMKYKELIKN